MLSGMAEPHEEEPHPVVSLVDAVEAKHITGAVAGMGPVMALSGGYYYH